MYLLIDECCSKALVQVAEKLGHTAQRTVEVRELGSGASDKEIAAFARRHDAIVVTENAGDFIKLAGGSKGHAGMILMPNVFGKQAGSLFKAVLPTADQVFASQPNMFVEIDEAGKITSFQIPAP